MQKRQTNTMKGFTIIEVVLVLAIAGLIFLMVFIALPALQRSQRDTQRRDDMSRFMSSIQNYQSNNNGKVPTTNAEMLIFLRKYLSMDPARVQGTVPAPNAADEFVDPDGNSYGVVITSPGAAGTPLNALNNMDHIVHYYTGVKCGGGEGQLVANAGNRNYAILYKLEGAGVYCGDNS